MFRKWMISAIAVCMLCSGVVCASETETEKTEEKEFEAVSSASVTDYYGDFALSGDELMEAVKAEKNTYISKWEAAGIFCDSAADSQALMQLTKKYCEQRNCLRCRFGYEYIKRNPDFLGEE